MPQGSRLGPRLPPPIGASVLTNLPMRAHGSPRGWARKEWQLSERGHQSEDQDDARSAQFEGVHTVCHPAVPCRDDMPGQV